MSKLSSIVAALSISALLAIGLSGCINITVTDSGNSNKEEGTTQSTSSSASTSSSFNSDSNASSNSSTNSNTNSNSNLSSESNKGSSTLAGSQKIGKKTTGYLQVPSDWKDRTSEDFDSRKVDSSDITYVVDPTSEYTSAVLSHYSFSTSLMLEVFPCGYTDKADEMLYGYRGKSNDYSSPTIEKTKFCGHDASIVNCESADGVHITNIVFDKDGNGTSCVMITANSTSSTNEGVMAAAATWSES